MLLYVCVVLKPIHSGGLIILELTVLLKLE